MEEGKHLKASVNISKLSCRHLTGNKTEESTEVKAKNVGWGIDNFISTFRILEELGSNGLLSRLVSTPHTSTFRFPTAHYASNPTFNFEFDKNH